MSPSKDNKIFKWDSMPPSYTIDAQPPNCAWSNFEDVHEADYICVSCRRYFCVNCYDVHVCEP